MEGGSILDGGMSMNGERSTNGGRSIDGGVCQVMYRNWKEHTKLYANNIRRKIH